MAAAPVLHGTTWNSHVWVVLAALFTVTVSSGHAVFTCYQWLFFEST